MAGQHKYKTMEGQHFKEYPPRLGWETNQSWSQRLMCNVIHHDITYKNKKTGKQPKYSLGEGNYGIFTEWSILDFLKPSIWKKKKDI